MNEEKQIKETSDIKTLLVFKIDVHVYLFIEWKLR